MFKEIVAPKDESLHEDTCMGDLRQGDIVVDVSDHRFVYMGKAGNANFDKRLYVFLDLELKVPFLCVDGEESLVTVLSHTTEIEFK